MSAAVAPIVETEKRTPPPKQESASEASRWEPLLGTTCQLTVDLAVPNFHVADFLKLRKGSVISTGWRATRDVPSRVNGILIGWGEFEAVGKKLAVRLTDLA
jgi:flagellar motor switch/type III secretory pathway protein FliN